MKNWSGIFDLLNPDNTMTFNRLFAHSIGATETIIYFSLISKCRWWEMNNQLIDGEWFYSTTYDLQESTTFSEYQQKKAITKLEKLGLIKCATKGIPAKRCFVINDNLNLLYSIIEDGRKIAEQLHEKAIEKNQQKCIQRKNKSECSKCAEKLSSEVFSENSTNAIHNMSIFTPKNNVELSSEETTELVRGHKLFTQSPENNAELSSEETAELVPEKLQDKHSKNCGTNSEVFQEHINKLNKNNLNENNLSNQSISNDSSDELPDRIDKIDSYSQHKELVYSNIEYETITENNTDKPKIDEIVENMLEMLCCTSPTIRIAGGDISAELVKNRVLKITSEHIDYILLCLKRNTTKVRNIKAYLRTVIYNAPSTIESFFDAEVNSFLNSPSEN